MIFSCPFAIVVFVFCLWLYYTADCYKLIEKIGHPENRLFPPRSRQENERTHPSNFILKSQQKNLHDKIRNLSHIIDKNKWLFYNRDILEGVTRKEFFL